MRGWVAVLAVLQTAGADVIFRVPEVLVRHSSASRPVGTGRANVSKAADSERRGTDEALLELRYEEYFIEHEVTTPEAKEAAAKLNLDDVPETLIGCGTCSRRELQYCETRVLADHCCCERSHIPEPLPWIPHVCYMGPGRCKPIASDCAQYRRLLECCCLRVLAVKWKHIMSSSPSLTMDAVILFASLVIWIVVL